MFLTSTRIAGAICSTLLVLALGAQASQAGEQNAPPKTPAATPTKAGVKLTDSVTVQLATSKIALGEPVELVFRVGDLVKKPALLPDFVGGQSIVRLVVKDDHAKPLATSLLRQEQLNFEGLRVGQRLKGQQHSQQRATYHVNDAGDHVEVHVWLTPEQAPISKAGTYNVTVALGKARVPVTPNSEATSKAVSKTNTVVADTAAYAENAENLQGNKNKEFTLLRGAEPVSLTLQVKDDDLALLKKADALRYKIIGAGPDFIEYRSDEIVELFSLTGPVARRVQNNLFADMISQPSRSRAIFGNTLTRAASPYIVDVLAEQAWSANNDRAGAKQLLSNISGYSGSEIGNKIVYLFKEHGEKLPRLIQN